MRHGGPGAEISARAIGKGVDERRRYHVGNLRARLVEAARAVLETEGPAGLNLRALAARAGITAGSVYHHYAGKTELLGELAGAGFGDLRRALEQADRAAPEGGRLRAWALTYFDFAHRQPGLYGLMFDPAIAGLASVAEAREAALANLRQLVARVAAQQGRDRPVEQIALAIWAAAHGAASLTISGAGGDHLMEDVIGGLEALFRPA